MHFFLMRLRRTGSLRNQRSFARWHFSLTLGYLFGLVFLLTFVPVLSAQAAVHAHQGHPIDVKALGQQLKRSIHVTHTGHVSKASVSAHTASANVLPAYNNVAISDDRNTASGNIDGQGDSYSAQALQNIGLMPGLLVTTNNITYTWPNVPSGSADNYQAAGQVLTVPPLSGAASVGFLGAATNGNTSGTATLTFTDGTTQTFTLGLTDWTMSQGGQSSPSFGNTIVATALPVLNTSVDQHSVNTYLFSAQQALPAGKTLQSVTLPTNASGGQLHIFAVGLSGPAYNNTATSDDSSTTAANIDGQGNSYSAQALQSVGISSGKQVASDDIAYTWPTASSGSANDYQANGQTLPVTPVANATTLGFVGAATNGASSGTATITYSDGTTQTFTLGFADWTVSSTTSLPYGDAVLASMTYRNIRTGKQTITTYLFTTEVALSPGKTVQSVTLPTTVSGGQLHVFSVSTRSAFNNVGSSLGGVIGSGNYDNQHNSYSVQALQAAGLAPGQPFVFNGVNFPWPQSDGVTGDNYQAAGQAIAVTPVPNATVLAFLGAATNGASSGTATLTYSDGTTQTFTLGFADWTVNPTASLPAGNRIAATMSSINTATGTRAITISVLYTEVALQANKTLQTVTLPTTLSGGQLHVFAVGTRSAYNNIGLSDDANAAGADFDGNGASYSAQDFSDPNGPGWNPGDTLTYEGINYVWPGVPGGQGDNYAANGQTIPVSPVAGASTIGFVGSATNAFPSVAGTATLTYSDGSTQTFSLGLTDWLLDGGSATPLAGNHLFAVLPHVNTVQGQQATPAFLFEVEAPVNSSKTLQSVTLPATVNQNLHIFMIGTRAGTNFLNNVGTSDNSQTLFANYDSNGASYSNQALESASLFAGQPFLFQGVSFIWSPSYAVVPDNYQAAGQVVPVAAVPGANTLAFLGSATNGTASGTATLTYTDGTTQTFTLGFADWVSTASPLPLNNVIAASMSYRNAPAGQQSVSTFVFETEVPVTASKTLQSVTLPATVTGGQLHVFSVGTRAGSYNNAGTSDDARPTYANYDGSGKSYSQQALQTAGLTAGQPVTVNGVTFTWPNVTAGFYNNYQAAGQVVPVVAVANASTLAFLGSATNGPSSGTATITYTDGTTQTFTLGFADWTVSSTSSLPYSNQVAFTTTYRNGVAGQQTINTYLFFTSVPISSGKTVQSVTLPTSVTQGRLHVFAVGLK